MNDNRLRRRRALNDDDDVRDNKVDYWLRMVAEAGVHVPVELPVSLQRRFFSIYLVLVLLSTVDLQLRMPVSTDLPADDVHNHGVCSRMLEHDRQILLDDDRDEMRPVFGLVNAVLSIHCNEMCFLPLFFKIVKKKRQTKEIRCGGSDKARKKMHKEEK